MTMDHEDIDRRLRDWWEDEFSYAVLGLRHPDGDKGYVDWEFSKEVRTGENIDLGVIRVVLEALGSIEIIQAEYIDRTLTETKDTFF